MSIPSGKITFLFTDIEGSTKLAHEFHELLPEALQRHQQILHEAVAANNGYVFRIIGDAFSVRLKGVRMLSRLHGKHRYSLAKNNGKG